MRLHADLTIVAKLLRPCASASRPARGVVQQRADWPLRSRQSGNFTLRCGVNSRLEQERKRSQERSSGQPLPSVPYSGSSDHSRRSRRRRGSLMLSLNGVSSQAIGQGVGSKTALADGGTGRRARNQAREEDSTSSRIARLLVVAGANLATGAALTLPASAKNQNPPSRGCSCRPIAA